MSKREHNGINGLLPDGYLECDWIRGIEGYGNYIDTEYKPNDGTGFMLDFSELIPHNNDFNFFGCKNNEGDNSRYMLNAMNYNQIGYGFNSYVNTGSIDYSQRHVVKLNYLNDRKFEVDGTVRSTISGTLNYMLNNIGIFASIQIAQVTKNSGYDYKVHRVVITQGEDIVREFIPSVRIIDMKPGMYELFENNCSITNSPLFVKKGGSGEFSYQLK